MSFPRIQWLDFFYIMINIKYLSKVCNICFLFSWMITLISLEVIQAKQRRTDCVIGINTKMHNQVADRDIWDHAWVTANNDFLTTSDVGDLPMTKQSLLTVTKTLFHFLHAIICSAEYTIPLKNIHRSLISLSPRRVFSDLALWHHQSWSVMSRECQVLALWRPIRRLFLYAQTSAKAIFTSE